MVAEEKKEKEEKKKSVRRLPSKKNYRKAKKDREKIAGQDTFQMTVPTMSSILDSAVIAVANTMDAVALSVEGVLSTTPTESEMGLADSDAMSALSTLKSEEDDSEEFKEKVFSSFEMKIMYFMRNFGSL